MTEPVTYRVTLSEYQRLETVIDLAQVGEVAREAMRFGLAYYEKHRTELKEAIKRARADKRKRS